MKLRHAEWIACGSVLLLATACGESRDVDVSGEITSAPAGEPVRLEFYERMEPEVEGEPGELELVHTAVLDEAGAFKETIPLEGDELLVVAIIDRDGNEACTAGEAWASAEVTVGEGDAVEVSLDIQPQTSCPALGTAN
jgi:hypothetical protein